MGRPHRHVYIAALLVAGAVLAAAQAHAQCTDDDELVALGVAARGDLIRIGRGGSLTSAGMQGCGLALETRIAGRKLSFVSAELRHAWDVGNPLGDDGETVRFSQAGIDLWRSQGLRWTVRASAAEALPEERDLERLAGADPAERQLGARGLAMTSILRTRDGRAEWLSELAGANNGADQWGTATRQRLRAILLQGNDLRIDGILRHQRAEPAFDGPASALERDRELHAAGLTARVAQWTLALDHHRSRDNLDRREDQSRAWIGWTGTVRYRFDGAAAWAPREAAVVLNRTERTTAWRATEAEAVRRSDRTELKLAWPGPLILRLEAIRHADAEAGRSAGQAREFAIGAERHQRAGDWRWFAAGRIGHLAGDEGFESAREDRLTLSLGAEALDRLGLRLGLRAEAAEITPRGEAPYRDNTVQVRANLRF
ncbi:MAG: hypothetical protein RIM84_06580 [Alphaproteobacteria bacterium]